MSEEKDTAQAAREMAEVDELSGLPPIKPQLEATAGLPERKAVARRQKRVAEMMHTLPPAAQEAIRRSQAEAAGQAGPQPTRQQAVGAAPYGRPDTPTQSIPRVPDATPSTPQDAPLGQPVPPQNPQPNPQQNPQQNLPQQNAPQNVQPPTGRAPGGPSSGPGRHRFR
jgi:phospholipid/cholesterol/gamma-HCH transport system ATP-binding protein